jgi:hypothetical protein
MHLWKLVSILLASGFSARKKFAVLSFLEASISHTLKSRFRGHQACGHSTQPNNIIIGWMKMM